MARIYLFNYLLVLLIIGNASVSAQTTIFNVPSTDVTPEKKFYFETDFYAHFDKYRNGGFQIYGYKTIGGLRKNVEIGTNFFFTKSSSPSLYEVQANAKFRIYTNEKLKLAVAAGTQVFVPLRNRASYKTFSMFYANTSKVITQAKGMRLTGGYYTVVGVRRDFGSKIGAIAGIEQPVFRKINFLADWYSGKNRFGYSAAGFSFTATKKQILYAGYNFGNVGRGNNAFSFFYGINF